MMFIRLLDKTALRTPALLGLGQLLHDLQVLLQTSGRIIAFPDRCGRLKVIITRMNKRLAFEFLF